MKTLLQYEVTAEVSGCDLLVTFMAVSCNDGGQSDEVGEVCYFVDGEQIELDANYNHIVGGNVSLVVADTLEDMFSNFANYEHSFKVVPQQSEYD